MKKDALYKYLLLFIVCALIVGAGIVDGVGLRSISVTSNVCQAAEVGPAQERAMKVRAETVMNQNDSLIQKTIRAYGGDYSRKDQTKSLTLNGKVYSDFEVEVIESQYIIIKTEDGVLYLEAEK